ncbi:sensor histidine kinase [Roseomonas sp. GCM10028921]
MPLRRIVRPALLGSLSTSIRWLGAAVLVLISFALRYWFFGEQVALPFLLFFPSIIVSAVLFDRGSGIFATLLSAALALYYFVPPVHSFAIPNTETAVSITLFLIVGLFIALVTEALHIAYVEVEKGHAEVEAARNSAEQAFRERDLLLVEFGHRVKNDLARISATIMMQAVGTSPETTTALYAVADRVKVLARVHDRLARRDGHVLVDMHDFLHDLVADLRTNLTALSPVGLFIDAEHYSLPVSRAGAVGLIANELITNALKHAFPEDREGAVRLGFRREGIDLLLTVADDGIGLRGAPSETASGNAEVAKDFQRRGGMGRRLVRALAAQLGGHIETTKASEAGGVLHTLRFPVEAPGDLTSQQD